MSNRKHRYFVVTTLVSFICLSLAAQAEWELQKKEDDVKVFTQQVEGSPYLKVKIEADILASVDKVLEAIGDGKSCAAWSKKCVESRVIKEVSATEFYTYSRYDLPWPVGDRDLVGHIVQERRKNSAIIKIVSVSDRYPEQGVLRAETAVIIKVLSSGPDRSHLIYEEHPNPGGQLPIYVVNKMLAQSALRDISSIRRLAEKTD